MLQAGDYQPLSERGMGRMNPSIIDSWIERLGHPHASLVTLGHLQDIPLEVVFMGQESETATPQPGLELEFSTEPLILKCVHVNVIRTIPQDQPYQGTLPDRLQGLTEKKSPRGSALRRCRSRPCGCPHPWAIPEVGTCLPGKTQTTSPLS